jgi:hypothetical protein
MHIKIGAIYIEKLFYKYDANNSKTIDMNEFHLMIKELMYKKELEEFFLNYLPSSNERVNLEEDCEKPLMTPDQLQRFFEIEQHTVFNEDEIHEIIDAYNEGTDPSRKVSFLAFSNIIFSKHNLITDPQKVSMYQVNKNF